MHYYTQCLALQPDNPRALEGMADAAKEQGEIELAKQYAARCYRAIVEGPEVLKEGQLKRLLRNWPDAPTY